MKFDKPALWAIASAADQTVVPIGTGGHELAMPFGFLTLGEGGDEVAVVSVDGEGLAFRSHGVRGPQDVGALARALAGPPPDTGSLTPDQLQSPMHRRTLPALARNGAVAADGRGVGWVTHQLRIVNDITPWQWLVAVRRKAGGDWAGEVRISAAALLVATLDAARLLSTTVARSAAEDDLWDVAPTLIGHPAVDWGLVGAVLDPDHWQACGARGEDWLHAAAVIGEAAERWVARVHRGTDAHPVGEVELEPATERHETPTGEVFMARSGFLAVSGDGPLRRTVVGLVREGTLSYTRLAATQPEVACLRSWLAGIDAVREEYFRYLLLVLLSTAGQQRDILTCHRESAGILAKHAKLPLAHDADVATCHAAILEVVSAEPEGERSHDQ